MKTTLTIILMALGCSSMTQATETSVEHLNSKHAFKGLPFSEAVRAGPVLYLSGQLGNEPGVLKLVPGGIRAEARQTMDNLKTTLEAHGYSMENLVKCTVMLADMQEWSAFNEVYRSYFKDKFPARTAIGVNSLVLGARVEIDCLAIR